MVRGGRKGGGWGPASKGRKLAGKHSKRARRSADNIQRRREAAEASMKRS